MVKQLIHEEEADMRKLIFATGLAVGYVLGTRAGRERYEQIAATGRKIRDSKTMRGAVETMQSQAGSLAASAKDKFRNTTMGERLMGEHDDDYTSSDSWETSSTAAITAGRHANGHTQGF